MTERACRYEWCLNPDHNAEPTFHDGVITVAKAAGDAIPVSIYLDTLADDPTLLFNFWLDCWEIQHDEVEAEFAALRLIIDQCEAAVKKAVADYSTDLPGSAPARFKPHRDTTTKPLRRRTAVDHNLWELSD